MKDCVIFKEMILAGIPRNLKLSSNSDGAVESFTFLNALVNLPVVVFEVEWIIVETAESHFDMKLLEFHDRYI